MMHAIGAIGLDGVVAQFGYVAIFLVIVLECAGLPLPGEATLIAAAVYGAATHALNLPSIVATAAAAAILGDNLGFWLGRRYGIGLLHRYGPRIGLSADRLRLGQYLFLRYGGAIVLAGRFVALLRTWAALLAGANRYPWGRFLVFNAAGGIVWATLYAGAAFLFGQSIHRVAGPASLVLLAAALLALGFGWRVLQRHAARLQAEADAALAGPEP